MADIDRGWMMTRKCVHTNTIIGNWDDVVGNMFFVLFGALADAGNCYLICSLIDGDNIVSHNRTISSKILTFSDE